MPLRILLAGDNAVNQKVLLKMLARAGACGGRRGQRLEVLAALEHPVRRVVLMDVQMPETASRRRAAVAPAAATPGSRNVIAR